MADDDEWTPGDVTSMIANPFYAINIDEGLAVPHEPLISEDDWVKANVRLSGNSAPNRTSETCCLSSKATIRAVHSLPGSSDVP
jgi:hypothetical protein